MKQVRGKAVSQRMERSLFSYSRFPNFRFKSFLKRWRMNQPASPVSPHNSLIYASQTALGRVGLPDDIGGVVAFLCSEEGRWVNAQRIEASGGMFL